MSLIYLIYMTDGEMVDVVNEDGGVLESVLKSDAHKRGLLHKTVISEVIDSHLNGKPERNSV